MKITVIGGGAAGMMCAALAAENKENKVTLIERNKILGIKLNITGKGRCNLTNDTDEDGLLKNTVTNGRFLYSAYSAFTPADVKEYFEMRTRWCTRNIVPCASTPYCYCMEA